MLPPTFQASAQRLLVVTDQPMVSSLVKLTMNHGHFTVEAAADQAEALLRLRTWQPDIAVLDMDVVGPTLLDDLEPAPGAGGVRTPVLALTRRGDLQTKLDAFAQGADDIMTIPFSPEELLARILAIVRRVYGATPTLAPRLSIGDLEVDITHRTVTVGGHTIYLSGLELALLYLLAANPGRTIPRDEILDTLWGSDYVAESNVVDRHVRSLRVRLQNNWRRPRFIQTVVGVGYRFIPQDDPAD